MRALELLYQFATILTRADDDTPVWTMFWRIASGSLALLILWWVVVVFFSAAFEVYQ